MSNEDWRKTRDVLASISIDEIKARLSYDPDTGLFVHLTGPRAGRVAGCVDSGYVKLTIRKDGQSLQVRAHRLAWILSYGRLPKHEIDHVNGNRADNRLCNLRDVTRQVNGQNLTRARAGSATGVLGVRPRRGGYTTGIQAGDKYVFLGDFKTVEEAYAAYVEAKRKLHVGCTI